MKPEIKHTPGPWRRAWFKGSIPICMGVEKFIERTDFGYYSQMIAESVLPGSDESYLKEREEIEANMALIAAAPALLESLMALIEAYKRDADRRDDTVIHLSESAILLATEGGEKI